jgi:hypothetical protein
MLTLKEKWRQLPWGPSPWPGTKEEAAAEGVAKYYPNPRLESCDKHGPSVLFFDEEGVPSNGLHSVRFTATGIWGCCAHPDAVEAFNAAQSAGMPTTPGEAHAAGLDFYWSPLAGKYCGHVGMKTLSGKCYACEMERAAARNTPRQQAISRGETWYQPEPGDLCKNGHNAPRRVSNGSCKECEKTTARPAPIWKENPDLIISLEDAKAAGLTVYRTGKPCRRGHASWRYISNGGCLVCMGKIDETR